MDGIGHLLVRLGLVGIYLFCRCKQLRFTHDSEQALRTSGIAPLPQPVSQRHHAQVRVVAAHIPDQLPIRLCVLVGMAVRVPGVAGQGLYLHIPVGFPEVDA